MHDVTMHDVTMQEAVQDAVEDAVQGAVEDAVQGAVQDAVQDAVQIVQVHCGEIMVGALSEDGCVYSWGEGDQASLGTALLHPLLLLLLLPLLLAAAAAAAAAASTSATMLFCYMQYSTTLHYFTLPKS
jgi:hypothetical protein